jgi:hypothetical protein
MASKRKHESQFRDSKESNANAKRQKDKISFNGLGLVHERRKKLKKI